MILLSVTSSPADEFEKNIRKGKESLNSLKSREAITYFSAAIKLAPDKPEGYLNRALAYWLTGRSKQALADLDEVMRRDPKNSAAYSMRGAIYYSIEEYDKSIADLDKAIDYDPGNADALAYRAFAYYAKKEYGKAIADRKETLRLRPKDPGVYAALASDFAECPDPNFRDGRKALEYATKACELSEWKLFLYLEALAAAYAELGRYDEAITWQKKANELNKTVNPQLKEAAERRLKLYEAHKPFRR
jgi:serine/threonine-protein kinase